MKKIILSVFIPLLTLSLLTACFSSKDKVKGTTARRMELMKQGLTIDAKYDPRLDNLIPGYKMMTVVLTNNSFDVLRLNPLKDRWEVTDAYGKKLKGITSLRIKDPRTFGRLPGKVQQMIDYPVGISVGYSETLDIFFPLSRELASFRSVSFYNAERKVTYDVLNNLDSPSHKPANQKADDQAAADPRFQ